MHKDEFYRKVPVEKSLVTGQSKDLGMFGKDCVFMEKNEWF
jgi:hypothetical protein